MIFFCSQQRTDGQFLRITDPVGYFKYNFSIMNVIIIVIVDVVYQLYFHLNLKEYSVELFTLGNNYSSNVYSTILVLQKIELILELNDYLRK